MTNTNTITTKTRTTRLTASLLFALLAACTAVPDDDAGPSVDELEADALDEERAGAERPSADPGRTADPERDQIDELRGSLCTQEQHPPPPRDLTTRTLARGLVDPRFRVEEDQEQAGLAALEVQATEGRHLPSLTTDAATLDAQARYLAAVEELEAEAWDSPQALAEAKAREKGRVFGE